MIKAKATDILAANKNVKAFLAANDDMGLGVVKAVENAGLTGKVTRRLTYPPARPIV